MAGQRVYCSAYGCINSTMLKPLMSFFQLPGDANRRAEWLHLISREDLLQKKPKCYRVCEEHFNDLDIVPGPYRKKLRKTAMPSFHLFTVEEQKQDKGTQTVDSSQLCHFVQTDEIYLNTTTTPTSDSFSASAKRKRKAEPPRVDSPTDLRPSPGRGAPPCGPGATEQVFMITVNMEPNPELHPIEYFECSKAAEAGPSVRVVKQEPVDEDTEQRGLEKECQVQQRLAEKEAVIGRLLAEVAEYQEEVRCLVGLVGRVAARLDAAARARLAAAVGEDARCAKYADVLLGTVQSQASSDLQASEP